MKFKTKFCWWPVPLYRMLPDTDRVHNRLEHIGYTWMARAPLTNNLNLGWIHILDSKPFEYTCPTCKQKVKT